MAPAVAVRSGERQRFEAERLAHLESRGVTQGFGATLLPAMELRGGVPAAFRTVVVVPTLLTTARLSLVCQKGFGL